MTRAIRLKSRKRNFYAEVDETGKVWFSRSGYHIPLNGIDEVEEAATLLNRLQAQYARIMDAQNTYAKRLSDLEDEHKKTVQALCAYEGEVISNDTTF